MIRSKITQPQVRKTKQPVEGVFCNYSHRTCMHNRLEGFEYCIKHILEDKNGPYKQCGFISLKNGKRCINAAPKTDKRDGYCAEHARTAAVTRQKSSRKRQPSQSAESLLESIDHYKYADVTKSRPKLYTDSTSSKVLEYASSSDSDEELPLVDQAWRGDGESDAESIDSEQEDYLKYAGIYTAEEVALIMRDKLIRLQSLYIDQFKRLQHIMKEKRRKYLHTYKQEKESLGSIRDYKQDPETLHKYEKLKYIKRYHRRYGKEALLHRQSKQRRIAVSEGSNYRPPSYPRCINIDGSAKCLERALPLSKYCSKHILNDNHQALFRQCSFGDTSCTCPVASWEEEPLCHRHTPLSECEPRIHLVEEEKEEALVLTKEALENLLPDLELNPQDLLLGNHFLGQNPEFPDLIFSGSDHEQTEPKFSQKETEKRTEVTEKDNITASGMNPPKTAKMNGSCDHKTQLNPVVPPTIGLQPVGDEQPSTSKGTLLLLQHLKGDVDVQGCPKTDTDTNGESDGKKTCEELVDEEEKKESNSKEQGSTLENGVS